MAEQHVDSFVSRLGDPGSGGSSSLSSLLIKSNRLRLTSPSDLKVRLQAATELRDGIEYATQGPLYPMFLNTMLPIIMKLLEGPPVFISTSMEQVRAFTFQRARISSFADYRVCSLN
jgi:hypothetical protein